MKAIVSRLLSPGRNLATRCIRELKAILIAGYCFGLLPRPMVQFCFVVFNLRHV
jgi:hypothetical protein